MSVWRVSTLLEPAQRPWRLAAILFPVVGALGLVAALVGIYGLAAYDVAQRRRELGLRLALGARSSDVIRVVLGAGLRVVVVGVGVGSCSGG